MTSSSCSSEYKGEEPCVRWNHLLVFLEQALISMRIVAFEQFFFFGSSEFVYFLTNPPIMKSPMVTAHQPASAPLKGCEAPSFACSCLRCAYKADRHRLVCAFSGLAEKVGA